MECRSQCGACCIAPSINQPYYGMPNGKPAGTACVHLDSISFRCAIWGTKKYPKACAQFAPELDVCGRSREQALKVIDCLEVQTRV